MNPIIEVSELSKSYQISHQTKASYNTIKDDFERLVRRPFGGNSEDSLETFWALKDVSFSVKKGEIFGIVGQNGSGKSTLLKILSRIVEPTSGRVKMHGRVASLLEVGTGFHPELTGRENIYFNGSMIGMSKQEVSRKFDEIVAFSEVEKFLDTPVKFYSSGMYVRLAFSIAAHLDPEILILDEVLSVGDAAFQKKSLNKITSTIENGTTVLFVSHSVDTVKSLCTSGLFLKKGRIKAVGPINDVLSAYSGSLPTLKTNKTLEGVEILSGGLVSDSALDANSSVKAELEFRTHRKLPNCYINAIIEDGRGQTIIHSRTDYEGKNPSFDKGIYKATVEIPRLSLNPGSYTLWFRIYAKTGTDVYAKDSERISVEVSGKITDSMTAVNIPAKWNWTKVSNA